IVSTTSGWAPTRRLADRTEVIKLIGDWLQTFRDRDGPQCCKVQTRSLHASSRFRRQAFCRRFPGHIIRKQRSGAGPFFVSISRRMTKDRRTPCPWIPPRVQDKEHHVLDVNSHSTFLRYYS